MPFTKTLPRVARQRAADLGDTERLVAAALANTGTAVSWVGTVDTDKVEILELALHRLPADGPDRALVLATLSSELVFGPASQRRPALAREAVALARDYGDDAIMVRVLNLAFNPIEVFEALTWSEATLIQAPAPR